MKLPEVVVSGLFLFLLPQGVQASITLISDFRFIRADAVIDVEGDGSAEIWDLATDSAPTPFGPWSSGVEAIADLIDGGSGGTVQASAGHVSSYDISQTRLEYSQGVILNGKLDLTGTAQAFGTSSGVTRFSQSVANAIFRFTIDDHYSFEGTKSGDWDLVDTQANVLIGSAAANLSGVIGPGTYEFRQTLLQGIGERNVKISTTFVVEAMASAVPEPTAALVWLGLAMAGMAYQCPVRSFAK